MQMIHHGTIEFVKKENELRHAKLQAEELERQYKAAESRVPQIDSLKRSIQDLEENLNKSRAELDTLSNKLEDPANIERWRPLDGSDLDVSQLDDKISLLEARINEKRSQLLEKELVLEEITALNVKMNAQVSTKREVAKGLADQLNELQCRIRDTTKRMLATVSELSMYQANALRLQQEKADHEEHLEKAMRNLENGEPPNEDAVRDLYHIEKRRENAMEATQRRQEAQKAVSGKFALGTRTTAEPRPTAYVPDDELGIPKPYGKNAPFKPSDQGSTMRHIRAPIVADIEI